MTVFELIEELRTLRPYSDVVFEYCIDDDEEDMELTEKVRTVFYDKGGNVVLSSRPKF